ncbi:hypothetical protein GRO01_09610 [Gluconobacter roseus NBRC 3990]|uniref:Uncharacterized protein n=1 Tax=Gluconobacter roseus NBRC 3990 TaxID=1307950 RepID=A0A4Y3M429_9PROT|nr:hypothetical protein GRO01_09610 [Gluconobacter roseus NBRC 3990]GLP93843.1 hypothetical protein GCM10007871_18210 [Gluconobacter roseus NBRC 3990]
MTERLHLHEVGFRSFDIRGRGLKGLSCRDLVQSRYDLPGMNGTADTDAPLHDFSWKTERQRYAAVGGDLTGEGLPCRAGDRLNHDGANWTGIGRRCVFVTGGQNEQKTAAHHQG